METILVYCKNGILYAGRLLSKLSKQEKWLTIKPSAESNITVSVLQSEIAKIYMFRLLKYQGGIF